MGISKKWMILGLAVVVVVFWLRGAAPVKAKAQSAQHPWVKGDIWAVPVVQAQNATRGRNILNIPGF